VAVDGNLSARAPCRAAEGTPGRPRRGWWCAEQEGRRTRRRRRARAQHGGEDANTTPHHTAARPRPAGGAIERAS
jgi:hypothetical protein